MGLPELTLTAPVWVPVLGVAIGLLCKALKRA